MFHRRQYAMSMDMFLQCVAHYTGLATCPPRHLHVSLVFYVAANARGIGDGEFDVGLGGGGVRELAKWRRVQEMARRRAQTMVWGRRYPSAVLLAQPGSG